MSLPCQLEKFRTAEVDSDQLAAIFNQFNLEEITSFCCEKLQNPTDAAFALRITLNGALVVSKFRLGLLRTFLEILFGSTASAVKVNDKVESDIVAQVLLHLELEPKLTSSQLQQLIVLCQNELKSTDSKFNAKWLPIMSKLLSCCLDHDKLPNLADECEVSGVEFRQELIRNLCIKNLWKGDKFPLLLKMFREISQLTNNELEQIFTNLLEVELKHLEPEQVPPVVYQIMLMTSQHPSFIIKFMSLMAKYYNNVNDSDEDSEDMIGSSRYSINTVKRSESISMVHINTEARSGHPIVKELLKLLKVGVNAPELVFNPFTLKLALSLTSLKQNRQTLVEGLKNIIVKIIACSLRKESNAWFSEEINYLPKIDSLLFDIIKNTIRYGSWELISDGIIDLAFVLLDIKAGLGGKPDAKLRQCWQLAENILKQVVKTKLGVAEIVIKHLNKRIMFSKAASKYTDTLKCVIQQAQGELMNKTIILNEILEHIGSLNYAGGKRVLLSLMPIIRISTAFRDQTILVIRKALFSPKIETRRIAINGVLALLKTFKIATGLLSSSNSTQFMMSQSSMGLSQVAADVHCGKSVSYEALCLELLGVLKRGFTQQVGVRMSLYRGLYDVVVRNPELCPKVLQMLYQHAVRHGLDNAKNALCPIDIGSLVIEENGQAIVKDPLGWFLHCAQLLVTKAEQIYGSDADPDDPDLEVLPKLSNLLEDIAHKFSEIDLNDMNIPKDLDCNKATIAGQVNNLRVETLKNCYEAIIEYVITHGADKEVARAQLILMLMSRHYDLQEVQKKTAGASGGKAKKKANDTIDKAKKAPPPPFELPEHAFSLKALSVILNMVLLDHKPDHQRAISELRQSDRLVAWIFRVLREKLVQEDKLLSKNGNSGTEGSDVILGHLRSIARVLVNYSVKNNPESDTSLLLQCIDALIQVINIVAYHFLSQKEDFFKALDDASETCEQVLAELIKSSKERLITLQDTVGSSAAVSQREDDGEDSETDIFKTIGGYFRLMDVFISHIQIKEDDKESKSVEILNENYDWMKRYCEKCTTTSGDIFKPATDLYFKLTLRSKTYSNLFKDIALKVRSEVGNLNESVQAEESDSLYAFINEKSGETIIGLMLPYLEGMMDGCDIIISRCKQLNNHSSSGQHELLSKYEVNLCNNLSRIVIVALQLTQTKFKSFEPLLKLIARIFTSVDGLTKYFLLRIKTVKTATDSAKFDFLIKHVCKDLKPKVDELFTFINNTNTDNAVGGGKKKKKDPNLLKTRVLRDTKSIPIVVQKMETLMSDLQKLTTKAKNTRLLEGIKLATNRDFRIRLDQVQPAEENEENSVNSEEAAVGGSENEEENEDISRGNIQAESTRLDSSILTNSQASNIGSSQLSLADPDEAPPSKKLKVKMSFCSRKN